MPHLQCVDHECEAVAAGPLLCAVSRGQHDEPADLLQHLRNNRQESEKVLKSADSQGANRPCPSAKLLQNNTRESAKELTNSRQQAATSRQPRSTQTNEVCSLAPPGQQAGGWNGLSANM